MTSTTRFRLAVGVVAVFLAVSFTLGVTGALGSTTTIVEDDAAQFIGSAGAAALAFWRGLREQGASRWWRMLIGCAMGSWAAGQIVWSVYQLVLHVGLPSPAWSDFGYLLMPAFAVPALLVVATRTSSRGDEGDRTNWRHHTMLVLDGLIVVISLLVLAWQTTLLPVIQTSAPTVLASVIAIAYPVTDLLLACMIMLLAVFRWIPPADRRPLLLLGVGLACFAASDSVFSVLVTSGAGGISAVADTGYVVGPALIALGMLAPSRQRQGAAPARASVRARWPQLLLPYLPLTACAVLIVAWTATGSMLAASTLYLGALVLLLVLIRQLITLAENGALLERIRQSQPRLRFQALHDPLTGLPNRALFGDRLFHATQLHSREMHPLALIFLDLDDFKQVNDRHGHQIGDLVLKTVAERLRSAVCSADTLARLGGDEFAVLLEGDNLDSTMTPEQVSTRILQALSQPMTIDGRTIRIGASVGLASPDPDEPRLTDEELLHRADQAMYTGKRQGKGRVVAHHTARTPDAGVASRATTAAG